MDFVGRHKCPIAIESGKKDEEEDGDN
jgi:hypothetical protein